MGIEGLGSGRGTEEQERKEVRQNRCRWRPYGSASFVFSRGHCPNRTLEVRYSSRRMSERYRAQAVKRQGYTRKHWYRIRPCLVPDARCSAKSQGFSIPSHSKKRKHYLDPQGTTLQAGFDEIITTQIYMVEAHSKGKIYIREMRIEYSSLVSTHFSVPCSGVHSFSTIHHPLRTARMRERKDKKKTKKKN